VIIYDHPLNERVRTLLRLEDLFAKVAFFSGRTEALDHHVALLALFEILEVSGRADLKSDLLQELERQKVMLDGLRHNPAISEDALDELLANIRKTCERILEMSGRFGQHLREDEWLMGIKQRACIPGGSCEFDLPSYHYWLHLPAETRRQNLTAWMAPMQSIHDGLIIVLRLLRDSGKTGRQVAAQGSFQQMLSGKVVQMLRIRLDQELPCIPEVSANKYAINIRFVTFGDTSRTKTCEQDIKFDLTLCSL
jgi:Uncharacterized protein conserved in bacteria